MKKILVPTDFSQRAREALDFAIQFNEKLKGKIILMHVLEFPYESYDIIADIDVPVVHGVFHDDFIDKVHSRLEKVAKSIPDGIEFKTKVKYGHAYSSISKEIAEEKVDFIIMGSNGASGLKEIFIGSVAEKVIRNADCPVITVKGPTDINKMKNFVFASDLSEEQDFIALQAKDIQELLDLNMHLLKVKTPHNFLSEKKAQEQLEEFVKRNYLERVTKNTIEAEFSDEGIVDFAEGIGAGMILMGTHGKTGLAHIFGGSRAEDVANESEIPVMTFKINL